MCARWISIRLPRACFSPTNRRFSSAHSATFGSGIALAGRLPPGNPPFPRTCGSVQQTPATVKSALAQSELKSPSRGMAVPPNLDPFPNPGGLFVPKRAPQSRFRVEYRSANRAFAEVSEQGGALHCFATIHTPGWRAGRRRMHALFGERLGSEIIRFAKEKWAE